MHHISSLSTNSWLSFPPCRLHLSLEPEEATPEIANLNLKETERVDPTKIVAKKGKVAAKNTGLKYQFQIMEQIGVPRQEIYKFADPQHWLTYFPPIATVSRNCIRSAHFVFTLPLSFYR